MFAQKNYLFLLAAIPFIALLTVFFVKKRKADLERLISADNFSALSNADLSAYGKKNIFLLAGFVFLIFALARPQYGYRDAQTEKRSSEIVIALDVSRSMLAEDVRPSRMAGAKMLISRVVDECAGDKIGVIVFSGSSMWQCPMTYDGEAVKMFLQGADTDAVPFGGTELSSPIGLALKKREKTFSSSTAMLLITDGEDHDDKTKESVESAEKAGLRIISVGIGTRRGAPIPLKNESGTLLGYVSDNSGKTVISRLDSALLKKISEKTGGKYFEMSGGKDISAEVISELKRLDKDARGKVRESRKRDRFQIFLFLALAAFIIEFFYPKTARNKK